MTERRTGEQCEAALWRMHDELVRIEDHWTKQVQAQLQRQAVVLSASGVLLGLVVTGVFQPGFGDMHWWQRWSIVLAAAAIAASLVPAGLALVSYDWLGRQRWLIKLVRPRRRPLPPWLDSLAVWRTFAALPENATLRSHWLAGLCASTAENQRGNRRLNRARAVRQRLLHIQLILLGVACLLLAVSVVSRL